MSKRTGNRDARSAKRRRRRHALRVDYERWSLFNLGRTERTAKRCHRPAIGKHKCPMMRRWGMAGLGFRGCCLFRCACCGAWVPFCADPDDQRELCGTCG